MSDNPLKKDVGKILSGEAFDEYIKPGWKCGDGFGRRLSIRPAVRFFVLIFGKMDLILSCSSVVRVSLAITGVSTARNKIDETEFW